AVVYAAYLAVSIGLTVIVASALSRSGQVYLARAFGGDEGMAGAVNRMLVVGFCLLSLGYAALTMRTSGHIAGAGQAGGGVCGGGAGGGGAVGEGRRGAPGAWRPAAGEHDARHPVPPPPGAGRPARCPARRAARCRQLVTRRGRRGPARRCRGPAGCSRRPGGWLRCRGGWLRRRAGCPRRRAGCPRHPADCPRRPAGLPPPPGRPPPPPDRLPPPPDRLSRPRGGLPR